MRLCRAHRGGGAAAAARACDSAGALTGANMKIRLRFVNGTRDFSRVGAGLQKRG